MTAEGTFPKINGDIFYATDANYLRIYRKQFSDATEYTQLGGTFVDTSSFTLSVPVNSLIIGVIVSCQLKNSVGGGIGGNYAYFDLKFTGTNLGTKYLHMVSQQHGTPTYADNIFDSNASSTTYFLMAGITSSYVTSYQNISLPIKILDASTTIRGRLAGEAATTGYQQSLTLDIIYVPVYNED